jgi:hypothetical protein
MSKQDEELQEFNRWLAEFEQKLRDEGYEIDDGNGMIIKLFKSEDEAREKLGELFGLPVYQAPEPHEEVALFFSSCPMHFPASAILMAAIKDANVGYIEVNHGEMFEGGGEQRECNDTNGAKLRYELMLDQLIEREWILAYRGPRLKG